MTKGEGNKGNLWGSLMLLDKTTLSRWSNLNKCNLEQCQHYKDNIPTTNKVLGWQSGQGWVPPSYPLGDEGWVSSWTSMARAWVFTIMERMEALNMISCRFVRHWCFWVFLLGQFWDNLEGMEEANNTWGERGRWERGGKNYGDCLGNWEGLENKE